MSKPVDIHQHNAATETFYPLLDTLVAYKAKDSVLTTNLEVVSKVSIAWAKFVHWVSHWFSSEEVEFDASFYDAKEVITAVEKFVNTYSDLLKIQQRGKVQKLHAVFRALEVHLAKKTYKTTSLGEDRVEVLGNDCLSGAKGKLEALMLAADPSTADLAFGQK